MAIWLEILCHLLSKHIKVGVLLAHRLRHWPNNKLLFDGHRVFAWQFVLFCYVVIL